MKVAICDDDKNVQQEYVREVKRIADECGLHVEIATYDSGEELLFHIEKNIGQIDLCLIDISMPGRNGLLISRELRSDKYHYTGTIVFVTASREYALDAFDVGAMHYIVKNETTAAKRSEILKRAIRLSADNAMHYVLFRNSSEYRNIDIRSITYFEVKDHLITVYYGEKESFEFYTTMAKLEVMMMPYHFMRIYRSIIVSVDQVSHIVGSEVVLRDGKHLPIGRSYLKDLKEYQASQMT